MPGPSRQCVAGVGPALHSGAETSTGLPPAGRQFSKVSTPNLSVHHQHRRLCVGMRHQQDGSRVTNSHWRRFRWCVILAVAVVTPVINAQQNEGDRKYEQWLPTTRSRLLSEERLYVEMPPQHRLLPAQRSFLAVCAIVKDERLDMVEWLVHHIAVGVGHFYIYDDHSDPPLRDLLEPWIQSNLVTYLRMVHDHEEKRSKDWQLLAYNHCLDTFSIRHEWMGFIDPDEFIYLTSPQHPSLQDLLVKEFDQYSGLVMTWKLYGSSGHVQRPNGTVLHSYNHCMPANATGNHHRQHKTLVHVAQGQNLAKFIKNAHISKPMGKAHPDASPSRRKFGPVVDEFKAEMKTSMRKEPTTNIIALLHYRIKSKEDFQGKRARGYSHNKFHTGLFRFTDARATADCMLPEVTDLEFEQVAQDVASVF